MQCFSLRCAGFLLLPDFYFFFFLMFLRCSFLHFKNPLLLLVTAVVLLPTYSWCLLLPLYMQLVQKTIMKLNSSPLTICFMYFNLPLSSNLLFVFCDHWKSFQPSFHSLLLICHSAYVSLVTAEDCWYPFSFCITSVVLGCFAMLLSSLSEDHHPNYCIQLWSQCSGFSGFMYVFLCSAGYI